MVAVAQAVIHEYAVVVKFLNAPVAKVAVIRVFGPQCFAGHAHVVKMVVFGNKLFEQPQEVGLSGHIARVYECQNIKEDSRKEKESGHY